MGKESPFSKLFDNIVASLRLDIDANKTETIDAWGMCYEKVTNDDELKAIKKARIVDAHTGDSWESNEKGYAHIEAKVGRKLTLILEREGYAKVQTATIVVPKGGLKGFFNEITFQTPSTILYKALRAGLGLPKPGCSHIVTTVQPIGHNMHQDKGMPGVEVFLLDKDANEIPTDIYLGQFLGEYSEWVRPLTAVKLKNLSEYMNKKGSKSKLFNSIASGLNDLGEKLKYNLTSKDGAAIFLNVPQGGYILNARKEGVTFSTALVEILPNSPEFINISPPQAPHEISPEEISAEKHKHINQINLIIRGNKQKKALI